MHKRFLCLLSACMMLLAFTTTAAAQGSSIVMDTQFLAMPGWDWQEENWENNGLSRAVFPAVATLDILCSDEYGDYLTALIKAAIASDNIYIAESSGILFVYFYGDVYCLQLWYSPDAPSHLYAMIMDGTGGDDRLPEIVLSGMSVFSSYYHVSAADYNAAVSSLLASLSGE